jgi:hypothetical protein
MQASDVIDQGQDMAERKKEAGASQLDGVARAVHRAADELENQMPGASDFIHGAASRLERGAEALRSRSIDSLMDSFNAFGRREPLALFGGAIIGGFAVARFLKSSSNASSSSASGRGSQRAH